MKINGSKVDTSGIKFSSRIQTADPIKYKGTATMSINGKTFFGDYIGDIDETRMECKQGAYISLRASCQQNGISI